MTSRLWCGGRFRVGEVRAGLHRLDWGPARQLAPKINPSTLYAEIEVNGSSNPGSPSPYRDVSFALHIRLPRRRHNLPKTSPIGSEQQRSLHISPTPYRDAFSLPRPGQPPRGMSQVRRSLRDLPRARNPNRTPGMYSCSRWAASFDSLKAHSGRYSRKTQENPRISPPEERSNLSLDHR